MKFDELYEKVLNGTVVSEGKKKMKEMKDVSEMSDDELAEMIDKYKEMNADTIKEMDADEGQMNYEEMYDKLKAESKKRKNK